MKIMLDVSRGAVLCGVISMVTGCATAMVQSAYWDDDPTMSLYVYGGTALDVIMVARSAVAENEASIGALLIFDIPFSLAADTILLPLTVYQQIDRAFWKEDRFIKLLEHPDTTVRARAARTLGGLNGTTRLTMDALVKALSDESEEVCKAAAHAIDQKDNQAER